MSIDIESEFLRIAAAESAVIPDGDLWRVVFEAPLPQGQRELVIQGVPRSQAEGFQRRTAAGRGWEIFCDDCPVGEDFVTCPHDLFADPAHPRAFRSEDITNVRIMPMSEPYVCR